MSDAHDRMQRVSELAKLINGFPFDSSDFASEGDVPLVRIRDVLSELFETYVPANVVPRNVLLRDDDVVIGMDGDFNSTLWRRGEAALNQRVCALRSVNGTDPRYLAYALPEHLKVINDLTWSTTVKHLTARQVRAIRLPEREAPEQRAIADFLDRETAQIDEFISENERFIELLTERRAAVIAHAVTKGLDPDAPMRDSGVEWLGEVPEGWEVGNIRRFAAMRTGHTPSRQRPEYWRDCDTGWFTLADVWQLREGRKYLGETAERVSKVGIRNSAAELLPAGTVVLSRTASVGFAGIMPEPMATSQDFWNWVPGNKLAPEYLWYQFLAMKPDFERLMMGSTHNTIYKSDAASIVITVPPVEEQRAIAGYLDERTARIDDAIATASEGIALAKERRSALISAAVTGKIDVTEGAA